MFCLLLLLHVSQWWWMEHITLRLLLALFAVFIVHSRTHLGTFFHLTKWGLFVWRWKLTCDSFALLLSQSVFLNFVFNLRLLIFWNYCCWQVTGVIKSCESFCVYFQNALLAAEMWFYLARGAFGWENIYALSFLFVLALHTACHVIAHTSYHITEAGNKLLSSTNVAVYGVWHTSSGTRKAEKDNLKKCTSVRLLLLWCNLFLQLS